MRWLGLPRGSGIGGAWTVREWELRVAHGIAVCVYMHVEQEKSHTLQCTMIIVIRVIM